MGGVVGSGKQRGRKKTWLEQFRDPKKEADAAKAQRGYPGQAIGGVRSKKAVLAEIVARGLNTPGMSYAIPKQKPLSHR